MPKVRPNCPTHTLSSLQTHMRSKAQHPCPPEKRSSECNWWEQELWRGCREGEVCADWFSEDGWGVPGDAARRCFPRAAQGPILSCRKFQLCSGRSLADWHKWTRCCLFYPLKEKRTTSLLKDRHQPPSTGTAALWISVTWDTSTQRHNVPLLNLRAPSYYKDTFLKRGF